MKALSKNHQRKQTKNEKSKANNNHSNKPMTIAETSNITIQFDEEMLEQAIVNALRRMEAGSERNAKHRRRVLVMVNVFSFVLTFTSIIAVLYTALRFSSVHWLVQVVVIGAIVAALIYVMLVLNEIMKDSYHEALAFAQISIALVALVVSFVALVKS